MNDRFLSATRISSRHSSASFFFLNVWLSDCLASASQTFASHVGVQLHLPPVRERHRLECRS